MVFTAPLSLYKWLMCAHASGTFLLIPPLPLQFLPGKLQEFHGPPPLRWLPWHRGPQRWGGRGPGPHGARALWPPTWRDRPSAGQPAGLPVSGVLKVSPVTLCYGAYCSVEVWSCEWRPIWVNKVPVISPYSKMDTSFVVCILSQSLHITARCVIICTWKRNICAGRHCTILLVLHFNDTKALQMVQKRWFAQFCSVLINGAAILTLHRLFLMK